MSTQTNSTEDTKKKEDEAKIEDVEIENAPKEKKTVMTPLMEPPQGRT